MGTCRCVKSPVTGPLYPGQVPLSPAPDRPVPATSLAPREGSGARAGTPVSARAGTPGSVRTAASKNNRTTAPGSAPTRVLSAAQARRIFVHAQGLSRARPQRRVTDAHFAGYLARQGVLQLDSVNVFARAHYLPFFSRFGAYTPAHLDAYLWGDAQGHSPHTFEHWGHEASVMPRDLLPALHHRMILGGHWKTRTYERLERDHPGLVARVREAVEQGGPGTAAHWEHLAPSTQQRGSWWDRSDVKNALEYLFFSGKVAASRGAHFSRTYDSPQRAWGMDGADVGTWGLSPADAGRELFWRALAACGVGTVADLADHFRLTGRGSASMADARGWAQDAVAAGIAQWVEVEGWGPTLLATGEASEVAPWHRAAVDPGRATGAALLSPFDPVCWYRPRLARMFGVDYRIEIYTPAPQRVFGYYCLPFLLGDQVVARVDLKSDRKAGVLQVLAAWREEGRAPGARPRDRDVAGALARELRLAATWQGLTDVEVHGRGTLAAELTEALAGD